MRIRPFVLALLFAAAPRAASPAPEAPVPTPREADAREILRRAVAFRTSIGLGQVPALAEYLVTRFRAAGFPDADIRVIRYGESASLVVRYRGEPRPGAARQKPIAFLGHMDVVTAKPEDWKRDPFTLVEENGYFFGRGTCDDKNTVALLTATFLHLRAEGFVPTRDLVLVFTGDEETEGAHAHDLVANHRDLVDAEYALNGDAGGGTLAEDDGHAVSYGLQTAEKTYASFELTVRNAGGHSSLPRKDNAIYELADALKAVQAYRFPVMWNETTLAWFRVTGARTAGPTGDAMRRFAVNPKDAAAYDVLWNSPADVGATRTTCIPTLLRGGHADNALPQSATATINCRIFPGVKVDDVRAQLQALAGSGVAVAVLGTPEPSDESPLRPDVLAAVGKAVHARHPGVPVAPYQESGGTDGRLFRAAGIPTYGVGETFIKDSDQFAHGLNERIPVASFYDGLEHWAVLVKELAGPR